MASRERSPALRIGIISDTHGSLDPRAYAALADCDHIIHAGDICGPAILRELETLAPVTAVLGNNDFDEYGSEVGHFAHPVLGGVRFLVGHKPGDVRVSFAGRRHSHPETRCPTSSCTGIPTYPNSWSAPRRGPRASICAPAPCTAPAAISAAPSRKWTWKTAASCTPG